MISAMCKWTRHLRLSRVLAALVVAATAATSRADFEVQITEDPTSLGATNGSTQTFTTSLDLLNVTATFADFNITNLALTSNSQLAGPPVQAELKITGGRLAPTHAGHTLQIVVSDNRYMFPVGPNYNLQSSSTDTHVGTTASDTHSFQSFGNSTATLFGQGTPSPGVTYTLGGGSNSHNEPGTTFSASGTYALTSITTYDSVSGSGFLQITGSTVAQTNVVPEPGSFVLLGGGLVMLGLARKTMRLRRSS